MSEEKKILNEGPLAGATIVKSWKESPCFQIINAWLEMRCDDFKTQKAKINSYEFMNDQDEYVGEWNSKCFEDDEDGTWWAKNKLKVYGLKTYKTKKKICKEGVETAAAGTAETATIKKINRLVDKHRSAPRDPADVRVSKEEQKIFFSLVLSHIYI